MNEQTFFLRISILFVEQKEREQEQERKDAARFDFTRTYRLSANRICTNTVSPDDVIQKMNI